MLSRFLQRRVSSPLSLALASLFLISAVSLAQRLQGWTARTLNGEETPANAGRNERMKDLSEAGNRVSARAGGEAPSAADRRDSDADGIPDGAELGSFTERENFRRWFTAIAEMQFYSLSDEWNTEQRDCAGLVRFSWREALRRHDRLWFQRMGPGYESVAPDTNARTLEHNPLGEKLFRTGVGPFKEGDVAAGRFSDFADARSLKDYNVRFVSRDRRQAEPGDLLFFFQPWAQKLPFHVMIFLGEARTASEGARDWVVYHTGASARDAGTVKKVRLAVLDHHPNKRWRPVKSNPNFLGFYRLKILD